MYDDLARIESIYGCVAEYNRCMEERDYEEYEPTEEEIAEAERMMAEYKAEIKRLNGEPSEFVKDLVAKWKETEPQKPKGSEGLDAYNRWVYAGYDWAKERCLDIVAKVADYYGVTVDEEWETFYRVPKGKYAISVEYRGSYIQHKHVGNLDLEMFKDVFRDLHYAGLYPTMSHNRKYVSNSSLGELLRNYIKEEV